jgi:hypothetical protein
VDLLSPLEKLNAIPRELIKAAMNHASPMHASNVNSPTEGILKNFGSDPLLSETSADTYVMNNVVTAQTKACDTAEPITKPLAFT